MTRLRTITETDRLGEAAEKIEGGEPVDWKKLAALQTLDAVRAGRAALLDALDREDEADANINRILGDR